MVAIPYYKVLVKNFINYLNQGIRTSIKLFGYDDIIIEIIIWVSKNIGYEYYLIVIKY